MTKKPTSKPPTDPEEYKRFLEMAREVGADETEEGAERAFKAVTDAKSVMKPRGQMGHK